MLENAHQNVHMGAEAWGPGSIINCQYVQQKLEWELFMHTTVVFTQIRAFYHGLQNLIVFTPIVFACIPTHPLHSRQEDRLKLFYNPPSSPIFATRSFCHWRPKPNIRHEVCIVNSSWTLGISDQLESRSCLRPFFLLHVTDVSSFTPHVFLGRLIVHG